MEHQGKVKLLDQVRIVLRANHYSPKTEESYVGWIKKFILFHNKRHPSTMDGKDIQQYVNYLAERASMEAIQQVSERRSAMHSSCCLSMPILL